MSQPDPTRPDPVDSFDPADSAVVEILLEDKPLLAVSKPAGLLTQGPREANRTLETMVREEVRRRHQKSGNVYLGVPHRLDRAVTGAIVFATNSKGAARLAEIFRDRRVQKTYWAVVEAPLDPPVGTLVDGIRKIDGVACAEIVPLGSPDAQEARLSYRTLGSVPGGWLVEIHPETGRFHQIRAQLGHAGASVVGDLLYHAQRAVSPEEADWIDDGGQAPPTPIALHSRQLILPHPVRFDELIIQAPLPRWWIRRGWAEPTLTHS
jgi:23S rRNA pseudouridine1911/1915/1917 synthase